MKNTNKKTTKNTTKHTNKNTTQKTTLNENPNSPLIAQNTKITNSKTKNFFDIYTFITFLPIAISPILALLLGAMTNSFETNTYIFFADISNYLAGAGLILYVFGMLCGEVKIIRQNIIRNNIGVILLWFFLIFVFISTAMAGFTELTVHGQAIRQEGILRYISYIILFTFATTIKNKKVFKALLCIFVIGITISAILYIYLNMFKLEWTNVNSDRYTHRYQTSGILHNPNHYAYLLSATCGILVGGMLFFKRKSIICASAMLFAINFVALIYNKTLGSVLAVIATVIFGLAILFFMLPKKAKKYTLISFSAAVLCGLVFVFTNNSIKNKFTEITDIIKAGGTEADKLGSGRYGLWRSTLEYIGEKPIFGYGPDGISQRLLAEQGAARTHNIFLEYTAFFGIPAVLVFLAGYVFVVIKSLRRFTPLNSAALLGGFAITMSLLTGISFGQTSPILYVLLGMSIASMDSFSNPVGTQSKPISNPVGTQSKPISNPVGTQSKLISPTQKPVEQISNPIETQLEQLDPSQKPTKMSKVQLNFFSGKKIE